MLPKMNAPVRCAVSTYPLLENVHLSLPEPSTSVGSGTTHCTRGNVTYYHYGCDGANDYGWGCAYRTLQSLSSWILAKTQSLSDVPSIADIQQTLYVIGDKPKAFQGSREWIGALEISYVLDTLYGVPCKILHVPNHEDLKKYACELQRYFDDFGGFAMMGGDMDAASKGIAGVHISGNEAYFLIVDPHYVGIPQSAQELCTRGYIRWQHASEFNESSFYNLCLPQLK